MSSKPVIPVYDKVVYISHAYGGKPENKAEVEELIKTAQKRHPNHLFISPIHAFGYLYDNVTYDAGLDMCLYLMSICEEVWVLGDEKSTGVKREIKHARTLGLPVYYNKL